MKVFLDTNVILEFFLDREDGKTAGRLFTLLQEQKHSLFMTVGSFYTMIFLVDKYLRKERGLQGEVRLQVLRDLMSDILRVIKVAGHNKSSLLRGISNIEYKDIEDSCQYQAAQKAGCEMLLTFNDIDYPVTEGAVPCIIRKTIFLAIPKRSETIPERKRKTNWSWREQTHNPKSIIKKPRKKCIFRGFFVL